MRILITGASGLLGLNLALELCRQHTVFGTANQNALHTNAFTVLQADLLTPGAVGKPVRAIPSRLGDPLRCTG